jgi:hypothetical protein
VCKNEASFDSSGFVFKTSKFITLSVTLCVYPSNTGNVSHAVTISENVFLHNRDEVHE